jgi:hypothetical protein
VSNVDIVIHEVAVSGKHTMGTLPITAVLNIKLTQLIVKTRQINAHIANLHHKPIVMFFDGVSFVKYSIGVRGA